MLFMSSNYLSLRVYFRILVFNTISMSDDVRLKIAQQVKLVKHVLQTLPELLNTPPDCCGVRIARLLVFYVVFCISLSTKHILL
jgi:hypothetical protein